MKKNINYLVKNGLWEINNNIVKYKSPDTNSIYPFGEIISEITMLNGCIEARIKFLGDIQSASGRLIIRHSSNSKDYLDIGINGYDKAYLIDAFKPENKGWYALESCGSKAQLIENEYIIKVNFEGSLIELFVNGISILNHTLTLPFVGNQVGFMAWGYEQVEFEITNYEIVEPKAFVIMEFNEPYNSIFSEIIKPICSENGIKAIRADDIYNPGIILQDIINGIQESDIIIAEVSPVNANVYYELGYSHALNKNTILLAEKTTKLPFDISSYRVIFYNNSIKGKADLEDCLRKHLRNIVH